MLPAQVISRLEVLEANVMHPEVVVVGGGYAGVEIAAVIADRLGGRARIKLLTAGTEAKSWLPSAELTENLVLTFGIDRV